MKIVLNKAKDKGLSPKITEISQLFVKHGFIERLVYEKDKVSFTCVAPFVKEMLAVQGSWLEMYIYSGKAKRTVFRGLSKCYDRLGLTKAP